MDQTVGIMMSKGLIIIVFVTYWCQQELSIDKTSLMSRPASNVAHLNIHIFLSSFYFAFEVRIASAILTSKAK